MAMKRRWHLGRSDDDSPNDNPGHDGDRPTSQANPIVDKSQLKEIPTPLTSDRIGAELTRRGYVFQTDDDGDLTGIWDGNRFWFILMGAEKEVLQVRGKWGKDLPLEARTAALQAANDWNRDRLWPKVYVRDEGDIAVYTEVSVDFEPGATDAQLADTIACGLVTATQFFKQADVITLGID